MVNVYARERSSGSFKRAGALPDDVDPAQGHTSPSLSTFAPFPARTGR